MTSPRWISAKKVAARYGTGEKWPWHQQKIDPRFPKGVRFSNGMTRWHVGLLDQYDKALVASGNHGSNKQANWHTEVFS